MMWRNRPITPLDSDGRGGPRAAQAMPTSIGPVTTSMALATPAEGGGIEIPAPNGSPEPVRQRLSIRRVLPFQRPALDDPLKRLGHIQPRPSKWGVERRDPSFSAPVHHLRRKMPLQVVPDQQHTQDTARPTDGHTRASPNPPNCNQSSAWSEPVHTAPGPLSVPASTKDAGPRWSLAPPARPALRPWLAETASVA